jgi:ribosomal protein S18 acetylase RimI-like enzyme
MSVTIRSANNEDAPLVARLLADSLGQLCTVAFGLGSPQRALDALMAFYFLPNNRFSQRYCHIADWDNQPAGLLLSFPGKDLPGFRASMAKQILKIYGGWDTFRFIWHVLPLVADKEAEADELLISNLAVLPGFQGKGIGRSLLVFAELLARQAGLPKCALEVDLGNDRARRLYLSHGYQLISTHRSNWIENKMEIPGFEKMVKIIPEEAISSSL